MKKLRLKENTEFAQVTQSVSSSNGIPTKAIYAAFWIIGKCAQTSRNEVGKTDFIHSTYKLPGKYFNSDILYCFHYIIFL